MQSDEVSLFITTSLRRDWQEYNRVVRALFKLINVLSKFAQAGFLSVAIGLEDVIVIFCIITMNDGNVEEETKIKEKILVFRRCLMGRLW